jgi:hypothetical protein
VAFGTQQAFVLPAGSGSLVVSYDAAAAGIGRWIALAALAVLLVLAAPPVRLRDDVPGEPDDFSDEDDDPDEPEAGFSAEAREPADLVDEVV